MLASESNASIFLAMIDKRQIDEDTLTDGCVVYMCARCLVYIRHIAIGNR